MRIAVVNATPQLGGAGIVAKDVAAGMTRRGHTLRFISTRPPKAQAPGPKAQKEPYEVELVPPGPQTPLAHYLNPVAISGLVGALRRFEPDVVNLHNINLRTFSAASLLISRAYPTAWTLHDVWPVCMTGWPEPPDCEGMHRGCRQCPTWPDLQTRTNRRLKDLCFAAARLTVVCPSQWMSDTVRSSALSRHPHSVIPNGVDPTRFRHIESARATLGLPEDDTIVLFSGGRRVSGTSPAYRKGWEDLRAALQRLGTRPGLRLLYVGDPIELPADFPIPVTFTGGVSRDQMPTLYSAADICALPTLADNAPLGVIEAMACGTALVATHTGGIPEVITDEEEGLLVATHAPDALAVALKRLSLDPSLRRRLAQGALSRIRRTLTLEHMLDGYESLFENLISRR